MKAKSDQKPRVNLPKMHIVSEEIDKMKEDFEKALGGEQKNGVLLNQVRLARSRRETRLTFILKGSLEDTEKRLQLIHKAITS